ncbi:putative glycogenin glucosyltransferase [Trypanosoma rangeli]|uniref:Putative glycogenin glucosyltransferase n=1 Tax=Trypanosoma rangeli TaxID=5698 RepID=A0A422NL25_TRYRA|nr:putative glycogenin glucosyltransferase [Trypanosoma rangeli]RNF06190.1 putative glycogenin glucosyltransferase [Trypanosoma rangeli]|eukprot:RNF06190.1 putative glycogenin glucosyltransferase [Trypanosoma rangeli]
MKGGVLWRLAYAMRSRKRLSIVHCCMTRYCLASVLIVWLFVAFCLVFIPRFSWSNKRLRAFPVVVTKHLDRVTDPVNELVAASLKQLHHGTYLVTSLLNDGSGEAIKFVFKTECRPASRWHGQQGWSEVAVHHFQRLFYGNDDVPYPRAELARGVVVAITERQLRRVVHKDQCGVLRDNTTTQVLENLMKGKKLLRGAQRGVVGSYPAATILMIGVALTWREGYGDDNYPSSELYAPYFTVPPYNPDIKQEFVHRFVVYEMSDVMVFDYLLLNPDRAFNKNWFRDTATQLHSALLDNGWAFAGERFGSSVCEVESGLLRCPSPLLTWSSETPSVWRCLSRDAAKAAAEDEAPPDTRQPGLLKWCRFRPETFRALNRTRLQWRNGQNEKGSLSQQWVETIRSDILLAFLLEAYGLQTSIKGFNQALSRYVRGCPSSSVHATTGEDVASLKILHALEVGLLHRMDRLAAHVSKCLQKHGEAYVYAYDLEE